MNQDNLFLGGTDRVMTGAAAKWLRSLPQLQRVQIPCAGAFRLGHQAALIAKPENVFASDIGLYSCVLGTLAAGRSIGTIKLDPTPWLVSDASTGKIVADTLSAGGAGAILWALRLEQLQGKSLFHQARRREWIENRRRYIKELAAQVETLIKPIRGINFECADLRQVLREEPFGDATLVLNPPAYEQGYAKMFRAEGLLSWRVADEYDLAKEWPALIRKLEARPGPSLLLLSVPLREQFDKADYAWQPRSVFAEEKKKRNSAVLHWLAFNAPRKPIGLSVPKTPDPPRFALWSDTEPLSSKDTITVHPIAREKAQWLQDLWTHKLVSLRANNARFHFAFAVNGKVWGVAGFQLPGVNFSVEFRKFLYEVYAVPAQTDKVPRLVRALMLCIVSGEFLQKFYAHSAQNRRFDFQNLSTTCFSKYRKVKHHRPPYELVESKKKDHLNYELRYECPLQKDWTFRDAIRFWEEENLRLTNSRADA
jgi:hypothetical protein